MKNYEDTIGNRTLYQLRHSVFQKREEPLFISEIEPYSVFRPLVGFLCDP